MFFFTDMRRNRRRGDMEEYRTQLRDAREEVASVLQESSNAEDLDLCAVRCNATG